VGAAAGAGAAGVSSAVVSSFSSILLRATGAISGSANGAAGGAVVVGVGAGSFGISASRVAGAAASVVVDVGAGLKAGPMYCGSFHGPASEKPQPPSQEQDPPNSTGRFSAGICSRRVDL
jgi:hypothetical protein